MDSSETVVRDETGIFKLGNIPIKHVPITRWSHTRHDPKDPGMMAEISAYKELRAQAAKGKTVTLQGQFVVVEPSKAPSWGYRMFFDLANAD